MLIEINVNRESLTPIRVIEKPTERGGEGGREKEQAMLFNTSGNCSVQLLL